MVMDIPSATSQFLPTTPYPAAAPTPFQVACRGQGRVSERGEFCVHGNIDGALLGSHEPNRDQNFLGSSYAEFGNSHDAVP